MTTSPTNNQRSRSQAIGNGGCDIVAHRDPLGLVPPIIKVQCKRTVGSTGAPDEQHESFRPEWKRLLPLRRVYAVDREPEAN
jgi:hypothetical protein